jgi:hypothetical protein
VPRLSSPVDFNPVPLLHPLVAALGLVFALNGLRTGVGSIKIGNMKAARFRAAMVLAMAPDACVGL